MPVLLAHIISRCLFILAVYLLSCSGRSWSKFDEPRALVLNFDGKGRNGSRDWASSSRHKWIVSGTQMCSASHAWDNWTFHLNQLFTRMLTIFHQSSQTRGIVEIADPSSKFKKVSHILMNLLNGYNVHVAYQTSSTVQWLERSTNVKEVMGSNLGGDSDRLIFVSLFYFFSSSSWQMNIPSWS